jgi:hypothetical protein
LQPPKEHPTSHEDGESRKPASVLPSRVQQINSDSPEVDSCKNSSPIFPTIGVGSSPKFVVSESFDKEFSSDISHASNFEQKPQKQNKKSFS